MYPWCAYTKRLIFMDDPLCESRVRVQEEQLQDIEAIHKVNVRAFGGSLEADLVDRLRNNCANLLSLAAVKQNEIVGHILFSPITIENEERNILGMGLAPMAVLPEHQRQGIGSKLITKGVTMLKDRQCPFIIVLGHAEYYPRFGFEPASRHGIRSEWKVPDDAFMILVLSTSEMQGISGLAKYRPEFAETV
jgi:putative acetyltransferase